MAIVALNLYDRFRRGVFNGAGVDFDADTIRCAVVTAGYLPDRNNDEFWDEVSGYEVSGVGYLAGGNVMANGSVALDTSGLVTVDADDPAVWLQDAGGFGDGRRVVIYQDSGDPASSLLIAYSDEFGADEGNIEADFAIAVNAAGLLTAAR
jgi:hypothetical protein